MSFRFTTTAITTRSSGRQIHWRQISNTLWNLVMGISVANFLTTLTGTVKELEEGLSSVRTQINSISRELTTQKTTAEPLASADEFRLCGHSRDRQLPA